MQRRDLRTLRPSVGQTESTGGMCPWGVGKGVSGKVRKKRCGCILTTYQTNERHSIVLVRLSHRSAMERERSSRRFVCEHCSRPFATKSHLASHTLTHTGEKPFACDFEGCDYRCSQACNLKTHKRTHTGEKPFACDFEGCDFRCSDTRNLEAHRRTHSERGQQRQKKREEQVARALTGAGVVFDRELTVNLCGEGNRKFARIDFVIYRDWGTILLEVDEFQHSQYPIGCDAARMLDVFAEQMKLGRAGKIHFIRFNPDDFKDGGVAQKVLLKDRLSKLIGTIDTEPLLQYSVTYLYYSRTDSPLPDVCLEPDFPGSLRAIANCY